MKLSQKPHNKTMQIIQYLAYELTLCQLDAITQPCFRNTFMFTWNKQAVNGSFLAGKRSLAIISNHNHKTNDHYIMHRKSSLN